MKTFNNPPRETWPELVRRPELELEFLEGSVRNTLNRVKISGDHALRELTQQYDGVMLNSLHISGPEINEAISQLDELLKKAIQTAAGNIRKFHSASLPGSLSVETTPGVSCWKKSLPIEKVGIYIPGGSAPLFSTVLMLGIPAQLAGCKEVILCTPPAKDGKINPAILFAASICGISRIFKVGGAQAIAALAYGTESIPAVYKIFGPGNQFVTKAKQMVNLEGTAIDLPAGPSEVMVIADESADADFVAADLLSQAEHGSDSQVMLLSTHLDKIDSVKNEIDRQLAKLSRKGIAEGALKHSRAIYFGNQGDVIDFANYYAPEHLIINTVNADALSEKVTNAGSVFLGPWSPESVGDYASGTNHTLPTNGFSRAFSGVSVESFCKTTTFQRLTREGLQNLGPTVEVMAQAEQLDGHKEAVSIRLKKKS